MKRGNLLVGVLGAMALASVAVAVTGCGIKATPQQEVSVPVLDGHVIIAYIGSKMDKVVTLYEKASIVCVENTSNGDSATFAHAAFSCWDVNEAPKKIQELVNAHNKSASGQPMKCSENPKGPCGRTGLINPD